MKKKIEIYLNLTVQIVKIKELKEHSANSKECHTYKNKINIIKKLELTILMMENKLKIAHLNAGRECLIMFGEWCNHKKIDIDLKQEPYLRKCSWENHNLSIKM